VVEMTIWSKFKAFMSGWPESKHEDEETVVEVKVNLRAMTKKQLEEHGRSLGIELDRRQTKKKLIATLEALDK